jgi:hypothetical protein
VYPQHAAFGASYRIAVDVLRFESVPGETAMLDAVWSVRRSRDDRSGTGRTTVSVPTRGSGYAPLAAAHSAALEKLSEEVSGAVREMEKDGK